MNWLPKHNCGLYLTHNEHKDVYEMVEDFYDPDEFISPDEWKKAIKQNSVWRIQWYPETPIGSYAICASTLDAIKQAVKEME